ncbi:hypothetical protein BHM03_00011511 [Ensete ventricosum]|uniref:Uncharacterized protein n=1 Tax=Ensete ventricosum TaxID=4639 RepID=A0A445MD99_ENSVE|nr:hypothetical protein BHM03_00011511 [Ensete ventricosum]
MRAGSISSSLSHRICSRGTHLFHQSTCKRIEEAKLTLPRSPAHLGRLCDFMWDPLVGPRTRSIACIWFRRLGFLRSQRNVPTETVSVTALMDMRRHRARPIDESPTTSFCGTHQTYPNAAFHRATCVAHR